MKRNPWLVLVPLALMAVACSAPQEPALVPTAVSPDGQLQDRGGEELPDPIVTPSDIQFKTSSFTFVRIEYSGVGSGVWAVDYPAADRSFSALFQDLTGLSTNGEGLVLELTDSNLSRYPFIYIVEGGRMSLSDAEVAGLRHYLLGGGFLMVDDFWERKNGNRSAQNSNAYFPIESQSNSRQITRFFDLSMSSTRSRRCRVLRLFSRGIPLDPNQQQRNPPTLVYWTTPADSWPSSATIRISGMPGNGNNIPVTPARSRGGAASRWA